MRWLSKVWELVKLKLGFIEHTTPYCFECNACGYDGCCPPQQCVGGFFCDGRYGAVRVGPIDELVQLRRAADDYVTMLTPKRVTMKQGDVRVDDHDVFGYPLVLDERLETHTEMRARIKAETAREIGND